MDWFPRLSFHLSKASASAFEAKLALQQDSNNTIQSIKIARERKLPRAIVTKAAVFSSSPLSSSSPESWRATTKSGTCQPF
jgi:hypothetical protein